MYIRMDAELTYLDSRGDPEQPSRDLTALALLNTSTLSNFLDLSVAR